MTVSYTSKVSTSKGFGCFLKLLARWRGSIYKLIWADLIVYIMLYYAINLLYRFGLNPEQRGTFKQVVAYCSKFGTLIPLSFVLGFYVNIVMTRWWNQYTTIPYPDNLALLVSAAIKGDDERSRIIRRTIVRYACLCFTITLTMISPKVKKRFPSLKHLVEAGLLMEDERKIIQELHNEYPNYPKFWLPLAWAANITTRARHEGLIRADVTVNAILQEINGLRTRCGTLLDYDWISIPLVYTQVVTIAVYTYFLVSVVGQQHVNKDDPLVDHLYFPILAVLEFFFYMGWLRVAETLVNPFGEDDDDFDVVWMIDRHVQVTYLIADKMHEKHPKLMQDQYWADLAPHQLPFTYGSEKYINECPQSSTANLNVKAEDAEIILPGVRRRTNDNSSMQYRASPSFLRNILSSSKNSNRGDPTLKPTALTSVYSGNAEGTIAEKAEPQSFRIFDVVEKVKSQNTNQGEVVDFDKLKKLRQLVLKQRIVNYMKLMKEDTVKGTEAVVDDIINLN